MFELIQQIPEPWRQMADVLIAPLAWIPRLQHMLWTSSSPWSLWLVAGSTSSCSSGSARRRRVWCTQLSL